MESKSKNSKDEQQIKQVVKIPDGDKIYNFLWDELKNKKRKN